MRKLPFMVIALVITLILALLAPIEARSDIEPVAPEDRSAEILQSHVEIVVNAILEAEGRCGHGQSGEYGCFQYQSGTWRSYSLDVSGKVLVQTEENERLITEGMVRKWILAGVSDRGILLTWNQGSATGWGPGTKDCYSGVNKYKVAYDSCDYAARGLASIAAATASSTVSSHR